MIHAALGGSPPAVHDAAAEMILLKAAPWVQPNLAPGVARAG